MKGKKSALLLSAIIGVTQITSFAEEIGVCTHVNQGYNQYQNLEVIDDAGIKWLRDECVWDSVEVEKGVFSIPERIKRYYKTAKENGIKTLLILNYGNDAYTLSDGTKSTIITMPTVEETEYMEGWKTYVKTIVDEMGDYVDAYEIWNEPDLAYANSLIINGMTDYSEAAEVYANLYAQTKALLDAVQPGKPVLFGCKVVDAKSNNTIAFYDAIEKVARNNGKTFDEYIEDVSIHFYKSNPSTAAEVLSEWESTFDSYGFKGRVWLTETGLSETAEDEYTQEAYLPMVSVEWDKYLYENGREGVAFWYDLRNDGTNSNDYESNFGIVDYNYEPKESFYAMQARNKAMNKMPLVSYSTPQTGTGLMGINKEYGVLASYSDGINTTYAGYDVNKNGATQTVNLSGTKAYVYDYLGNVITTLDPSVTSTYALPLNGTVTYVACVNPRTDIDYVNYDKMHGIVTVKGEVSEINADTLEISIKDSDANTVCTEMVSVSNGKFETEISLTQSGTYTVTAGADITDNYALKEVTIVDDGMTLGDSVVAISGEIVTITGAVNNAEAGETISVLVVPKEADLENLKPENIAYVDDAVVIDGAYSVQFTMPEKSEGVYNVLLSGANLNNSDIKESVVYGEASEYVNVCDFQYIPRETITDTATRNEEIWSENFEDSTKYTLSGSNQKIETVDGSKVLYGNRAYTLGGVTLPETVVFKAGDVYKLTYDLRRSKDLDVEASVMLSKDSTTSINSYRFGFKNGCFTSFGWGDAGTVSKVLATTGEWYNCEVLMDYDAKTIKYTVYKDGLAIYTASNEWFSGFDQLASIGLYFPGSSCGAYLDNIVLTKEIVEEIETDNDKLFVSALVNNPGNAAKNCTIIIAQYKSDGSLADVALYPVTVEANTVQAVEKTASCDIASEASTAKGFIYDGVEAIRPLVNGLPIPMNLN